jgi:uncharacterized protein (DUF305 family)
MKNIKNLLAMAALITAMGTAACAQKMLDDMTPKDGDPASTKAFKEAHMRMMHDMHRTFTGNPDVDFMNGMIPHHQGAIDMAKVQVKYGKDAETRKLAEQIIADQEKEIAQMKARLRENAK